MIQPVLVFVRGCPIEQTSYNGQVLFMDIMFLGWYSIIHMVESHEMSKALEMSSKLYALEQQKNKAD